MVHLSQRRPRGQSSAEYALLLVLIAVIIVLGLVLLGGGVGRAYQKVVDTFGLPEAGVTAEASAEPPSTSEPPSTQEATEPTSSGQSGSVEAPTQADQGTGGETPSGGSTPVPLTPTETSSDRYYDQFDGNGNIQWTNYFGTWAPSNQVFTSRDNEAKVLGSIPFANYDFTADVQTVQSMGSDIWDVTMVLFRVQDANTFYAVMLKKDGVVELASSRNGQWMAWMSVTATRLSPFDNHTFRVKAFGDHIQVFIDNKKEVDYRDSDPILSGGIGFSNSNSIGRVDNVEVDRRAQD